MPRKKPRAPKSGGKKSANKKLLKLKPTQAVIVKNVQKVRTRVLRVHPGESYHILMVAEGPGESSASPREKKGG